MRALAVIAAMAVGTSDPCTPPQALEPNGGGASSPTLSQRLELQGCVAQHIPRAMLRGSRARIKASVRAACLRRTAAGRPMPAAETSALIDRLVDQEIDYLTRCPY